MIGAQQVLRAQGAQALGKAAAQVVPAAERGVEPMLGRRGLEVEPAVAVGAEGEEIQVVVGPLAVPEGIRWWNSTNGSPAAVMNASSPQHSQRSVPFSAQARM